MIFITYHNNPSLEIFYSVDVLISSLEFVRSFSIELVLSHTFREIVEIPANLCFIFLHIYDILNYEGCIHPLEDSYRNFSVLVETLFRIIIFRWSGWISYCQDSCINPCFSKLSALMDSDCLLVS